MEFFPEKKTLAPRRDAQSELESVLLLISKTERVCHFEVTDRTMATEKGYRKKRV
jgi:hypothetical protein